MSDIALTVSILALVAVVGLWIGNVKIRGVGFGIGGVLFGGDHCRALCRPVGCALKQPMLHFVQEFGLILFVYTIGIRGGAGVFRLFTCFWSAAQFVCHSDCYPRRHW